MADIPTISTAKCCVRDIGKRTESEEMDVPSDGASSRMWNANGGEMESEAMDCVKVRCDEDDVNGVGLDIELEKWLGDMILDDEEKENGDGGLSRIEMEMRERGNSADGNGNGGLLCTKMDLCEHDNSADASGPVAGESADASLLSTPPMVDADRAAWVAFFCRPVRPVRYREFGMTQNPVTSDEVADMALEVEELSVDSVPTTPLTLTNGDLLQFYAYNRCLNGNDCVLGVFACGFCASQWRKRAREDLKEKADELKHAWKECKRVKETDRVRKTLFVNSGGDCDSDGDGCPGSTE